MRYFDYEKMAKDAGIPTENLAALGEIVRREFPWDDMMFELHLLRACMAVRNGYATVEEVLRSEVAHAA